MSRLALFTVLLTACGIDDRLTVHRQCTTDLDCAVGQICATDGSACVAVNGGDLATWPAPHDSIELLERFHRMQLTSPGGQVIGHQQVAFGGATETLIEQDLSIAAAQALVATDARGPRLQLWDLGVVGGGGEMQIWPPPARDTAVFAPIQSLAVALVDPFDAVLEARAYPMAVATAEVALLVTANIGTDAAHTVAITTRFDKAALSATFTVVDRRVHCALHVTATQPAEGRDAWLRAETLTLDVDLTGNEVPERWLTPGAKQ